MYKGINYDTGTRTLTGRVTREIFDLAIVSKEIAIIKNELNCNAIRISGFDLERIAKTAEIALREGLTVWFSPSLQYENPENVFRYIVQSAAAAEKLRMEFPKIIFVAGCELTLFASDFVKGATWQERIKTLFGPLSMLKNIIGIPRRHDSLLNKFLTEAVREIRKRFNGQVTYASGTWEKVDWGLFDIIGIDHYRASYNKSTYAKELRNYKKFAKPVSVMEFGCCTYKGAEDKGAMGWAIVDWKKDRPMLKGDFIRDEAVQAKYLEEILNIFEKEQIFATFVFTFTMGNYIYDERAQYDLDMASYGIVRAMGNGKPGYRNLPWIPKQAFFEVAQYYRDH